MKYFASLLALLSTTAGKAGASSNDAPNIIFLLVDDLGSGDVDYCPEDVDFDLCPFRTDMERLPSRKGILKTPRMRQMAKEGQILTNFYSPRPICTPSRAGILTGRDPTRYGMADELYRIMLNSMSRGGLPTSEKTVAKYLKELGYATGYSGKWHLGNTNGTDNSAYTPINHGFDFVKFFIEGSTGEACAQGNINPDDDNNIYHMCAFDHIQECDPETKECYVVEQPIRWENATSRHLKVFKDFIDERKAEPGKPFFYYHAFPHVHVPWVPSRYFVSDHVLKHWTDMVNEVDWALGYMFKYLKDTGMDDNTLVILTSDNGPYSDSASSYCPQNCKFQTPSFQKENKEAPNSKLFGCSVCNPADVSLASRVNKGTKTTTWEAGQRVPAIAWWPGHIKAGSINPIVASGLDLLPTFVKLAGGELDEGIEYDGKDISSELVALDIDPAAEPEGTLVYWCNMKIVAVRLGRFKVIFFTQDFTIGNDSLGLLPDSISDGDLQPTPQFLCGGTGECCAGSRGCSCQYGKDYDSPLVIDLVSNSREDLSQDLAESYPEVVAQAVVLRLERYQSSLKDRGIDAKNFVDEPGTIIDISDSHTTMLKVLNGLPSFNQVDSCLDVGPEPLTVGPFYCNNSWIDKFQPTGCGTGSVPEECQKEILPGNTEPFYEFQPCDVRIPNPELNSQCKERLPCCTQEGYKGPFEYIRPYGDEGETEQCGCFLNGEDSYFPDDEDMQLSLCDWQDEFMQDNEDRGINIYSFVKGQGFCRVPACLQRDIEKAQSDPKLLHQFKDSPNPNQAIAEKVKKDNEVRCTNIKKYGLSNIPTGWLFNSAYPDTQDDPSLLYLNQDYAPGECENGNGINCKNGNEGIKGSSGCEKWDSEKKCKKGGGCVWVVKKEGEQGSCSGELPFGPGSTLPASSLVDGSQAFDKPNSSMSVTAAALAWGSMAVTVMWFVMG